MTKRIEFIEIDLLKCQLDYGVAPCTAEVGVTGAEKCFNCRNTCQDIPSLDESPEVVRYSKPSTLVRFDLDAVPNITVPNIAGVNYAPPELKLGQSIGVRSSITVTFKDHTSPDTDASGDNYTSERDYDPYTQGTYWGKFRARYPSLKNRPLRWIVGTDDQVIADMETRHFVIDQVTGPNTSGTFTVTAKDILRLTGGDQSLAPDVTEEKLGFAISDTFTGTIDSVPNENPLAAKYTGYLSLSGSEVVAYSLGFAGPENKTIVIDTRGQLNTVATAHDEDAAIQQIASYDGANASDIMFDLLTNYAGVDPALIPLTDWNVEDSTYINRSYSGHVAQPTGVDVLINELLSQTASTMWWDNVSQLIRWQVLRQPSASAFNYDDRVTLQKSFNIADGDYSQRVSRVFVYFGQINPLLNLDELDNYNGRILRTETASEAFFDNKPAYKRITSRWIPAQSRDTAERLGDLILQRFSSPPRKVGFKLLRDTDVEVPELGGAYNASNFELQDFAGRLASLPIQITGLVPGNTEYTVKAEEVTFNTVITPDDPNVFPINISFNQLNVSIRELYDAIGPEPTVDTVVNVTIDSGVVVGSASSSMPALVSGDWPVGATINVTNGGTIVGRGGMGGRGAAWTVLNVGSSFSNSGQGLAAENGDDGGDAFEDTHGVNLTNNGIIGGGGGGGGGGGAMMGYIRFTNTTSSPGANRPPVSYWTYSVGSGGGGGAGNTSGGGGTAPGLTANVIGQGLPADTYAPPSTALSGSTEDGGNGGSKGFATHTINWGTITSNPETSEVITFTGIGGDSGDGGDLGQPGTNGTILSSQPVGTTSGTLYNTGQFDEYRVYATGNNFVSGGENADPGNGGAAGNAIVQNGVTTNIITAGDIRGAII